MRSIREYQSNDVDNYQAGIQSYRRLRKLLKHSYLDGHMEQTGIHAIDKHKLLTGSSK